MSPEELSQLCLKRLLSGNVFYLLETSFTCDILLKIANQQEPEILYVYVNSARAIKKIADQQLIIKQGNIKHLVMILHIGKKRTIKDGKSLLTLFISDDNNRGCHFVAAFLNLQKNFIYYGIPLAGLHQKTSLV